MPPLCRSTSSLSGIGAAEPGCRLQRRPGADCAPGKPGCGCWYAGCNLHWARATDKFGVNYGDAERLYQEAARAPGLKPMGIAMHIGSQIGDVAHSAAACAKLRTLWDRLAVDGVTLRRFDVGGGLGIRYKDETPPSIQAYADTIRAAVADIDCEVMLEPGRRIVGPAGVLIANVIGEKMSGDHRVIILDAAMNDLIRPALYKAWHEVVPLTLPAGGRGMDGG